MVWMSWLDLIQQYYTGCNLWGIQRYQLVTLGLVTTSMLWVKVMSVRVYFMDLDAENQNSFVSPFEMSAGKNHNVAPKEVEPSRVKKMPKNSPLVRSIIVQECSYPFLSDTPCCRHEKISLKTGSCQETRGSQFVLLAWRMGSIYMEMKEDDWWDEID